MDIQTFETAWDIMREHDYYKQAIERIEQSNDLLRLRDIAEDYQLSMTLPKIEEIKAGLKAQAEFKLHEIVGKLAKL